MYGPYFLLFYAAFSLTILLLVWFAVPVLITKKQEALQIKIPDKPDARLIAYLRHGKEELALVILYSLQQRSFIEIIPDYKTQKLLVVKKYHPESNLLNAEDAAVYHAADLDIPLPLEQLVRIIVSNRTFLNNCEALEQRAMQDGYIWGEKEKKRYNRIRIGAGIFLAALAIYKIAAAISTGHHNILFLIILLFIAEFVLTKLDKKFVRTGKANLLVERMELAFPKQKITRPEKQNLTEQELLISLYGFGVIAAGPLSAANVYISKWVERSTSNPFSTQHTNTGSSGCSTGSCGGGGCGGGCGGCGGCGG